MLWCQERGQKKAEDSEEEEEDDEEEDFKRKTYLNTRHKKRVENDCL